MSKKVIVRLNHKTHLPLWPLAGCSRATATVLAVETNQEENNATSLSFLKGTSVPGSHIEAEKDLDMSVVEPRNASACATSADAQCEEGQGRAKLEDQCLIFLKAGGKVFT